MPQRPDDAENKAGDKKVETPPHTVYAVCMPAEFLYDGSGQYDEPGGKDADASKGKAGIDPELPGAVAEEKGYCHGREDARRGEKKMKSPPLPVNAFEVYAGRDEFIPHFLVRED